MRLIDADKLKQHYAWWNDEIKELFDTIVDVQPTVEPESAETLARLYGGNKVIKTATAAPVRGSASAMIAKWHDRI